MAKDSLARGARSAQFGGPSVSQKKWDAIWEEEKPQEKEQKVNGEQSSK